MNRLSPRVSLGPLALALALSACRSASQTPPSEPALQIGVDRYHMEVTTSAESAQRWFDQGLQQTYGFHHSEAIRSYQRAAEIDPACAMAWWGIAYAAGPNINEPAIPPERHRQGYEAAQHALTLVDAVTPLEAALIRAVAQRYAPAMPDDVSEVNDAYAAAMAEVYREHGDHPDVAAIYVDALMNQQPWDYWDADDAPKGNTERIVSSLERTLELDANHPGALHLYIHAMEAGPEPEKAVPIGERLERRIPGSGHLVHMPSHIYAVVGRWSDAADANEEAISADLATLSTLGERDFYWGYYAHNLHFLAYAAMMEGRYDTAMRAARQLWRGLPDAFVEESQAFVGGIMPTKYHVMIRFGRWSEILDEPQPKRFDIVSRAVHHYARCIAQSALGNVDEARHELELFEELAERIPGDWLQFNNKMEDILPIARAMVRAELAFREGRREEAFELLRAGAAAEDGLVYDEPPGWMIPVRHALGALLMSADRYTEAEAVYREDLARNPNNGWSLLGLKNALAAQGPSPEIRALEERRARAWARADSQPTSSCYCEP